MKFMLADLSVIRQVPELKQLPDWNAKINIDKDFTAKFIKAKNALPDSENFGVACKNGKLDIIINYSSINTNRIKFSFDCDSEECSDLSTVCFSSNLFKEILGVVDSGYRGEITFRYKFEKDSYFASLKRFQEGDRVGQLVIIPYPEIELKEEETLSETERGAGGYGSTGK